MPVRIGVHVGEVELTPNGAKGIAIHEVARIAAAARSGEILTSEATRALSMSAGLEFTDKGEHQLKGLDGQRRLFAFVADR
jgi:class 3 adenylate cyclase